MAYGNYARARGSRLLVRLATRMGVAEIAANALSLALATRLNQRWSMNGQVVWHDGKSRAATRAGARLNRSGRRPI